MVIPAKGATDVPLLESRNCWRMAVRREEPWGLIPAGRLFFLELEFLDAVSDLIPIQAKEGRGLRLIPARALQGLDDQRPFELLEIEAAGRQFHGLAELHGHG